MISIVIPVYQEGETVLGLLEQLLQSQPVEECVVVDASDTQMFQSLKTRVEERFDMGKISYVAATSKGRANQMNQGAAMTSQPILLFLHADTLLPNGALEMIQKGMDAGNHWGRFDVCFDNSKWPYRMIASMMNWRSRRTGIATGDQAMFMSRAAFDVIGGFDAIPLMEDIALSRKLKRIALPLCLKAQVQTAARRWETRGVTKTILLMWWLRFAYWLGMTPDTLAKWYR